MTTVLTRSTHAERPEAGPEKGNSGRRVRRWPSGRATLGAVLIVASATGVLAAHRAAGSPSERRWVVVTRDVDAGTVLEADDLGTVAIDLPTGVVAVPAAEARSLLGSVTAVPLGEMALLRPGDTDDPDAAATPGSVEVAVRIDRSRDLGDSVHVGSRVDVLSTDPDRDGTAVLAEAVAILEVVDGDDLGIGGSDTVRYRLALPDAETAAAVVDASVRSQLTLVAPQAGPTRG